MINSCFDRFLRRTVCYKSLRKELQNNASAQLRFIREARVTSMLQHPNTIPTYELGRDAKGLVYFTMKLVQGETFRTLLDRCAAAGTHEVGGLNLERLISILVQVAHALHYAHIHGVVHRDVKPENILVGPFGEVLLLDWGSAKVWSKDRSESHEIPLRLQQSASIVSEDATLKTESEPLHGTPAYLSPEQASRDPSLDERSDVFSFGSILYETLGLTRMLPGEKVYEVLDFIQRGKIRDVREQIDVPLDDRIADLCMRMVERDKNDRLQSFEDALNVFET